MRQLLCLCLAAIFVLTSCESTNSLVSSDAPQPASGYEIYTENGAVPRPANAIDVYIVYSPESQQYMPELIRRFNQAYANGNNPLTGQPLTQDERPIYVWGTDPITGSSGTVAQGIVNAIIAPGNENIYRPTIFQPSVSHWLALVNYQTGRSLFDLSQIQPTALSPVVIGIWEERLQQLERLSGKDRSEIGWEDILNVLANGWADGRPAVYYGHTDPNVSSTGLSALIAEFYACARQNGFTARRLELNQVNDSLVQTCVRNIELLVRHYSRRTEDFLEYIGQGLDYVDFVALEETDLICINSGGSQGDEECLQPQNGERLVALYPREGTFWHEHPFGVVNADWVSDEQREAARIFTDFVLLPDSQASMLVYGFRPVNAAVDIGFPFVPENGVTVEGPATILDVPNTEVIAAIQQSWSLVKKQADILIVMDVSGSMQTDNKIGLAVDAALAFLEGMESTNRVGLMLFNDEIDYRVELDTYETIQNRLYSNIRGLRADGGTELYGALLEAVNILTEEPDEDRIRAVVLLSDGAHTGDSGVTLNQVTAAIDASRDTLNPVIVIPIAYGEDADINTLSAIARASQTRVQSGDVDTITNLLDIIGSYF